MSISATGLGSGLPIDSIISQLMDVESLPLKQLQQQQQSYQNKISAFGQVSGGLASLQAAAVALSTTANFNTVNTTSSDSTIASVTSTKNTGISDATYAVDVTQLAQGQRLMTNGGYATTSSVIGSGTLTFAFGTTSGTTFTANASKPPVTVTIPPNSTLQGIADAVNNTSGLGVQATIINDGITGNRLVYSTTGTGANNSLKVTAAGDSGTLAAFAHDPAGATMTQLQAAQDAIFKLNGVTIQKSSNTVTDAIDGLSFSLKKVGTGVSLTVSHDSSGAAKAINSFVTAYNGLIKTLSQVSAYDPTPVAAGQAHATAPLNGDPAVLSIKTQLRSMFNKIPAGLESSAYRVPADVGLTFDNSGQLSLDSSKLQKALTANPQAVAALFGALGTPTDSQVSFVSGSTKTQVGTYAVNMTGMQHGVLLGTPIASGSYPISSSTLPAFSMSVDGVALTNVAWPAGQTYNNATQVAAALQSTINSALTAAPGGSGKAVTVSVDPGTGGLLLQSNTTGTASSVTVTSGLASLGFANGSTNTGQASVSGTIGGYAATGNGSTLVGAVGTPVEGLTINIAGGATGSRGTVAFTKGFANQMDALLTKLQGTNGPVTASIKSLNAEIATVGKSIDAMNLKLAATRKRYQDQFNSMDSVVGNLKSLGNYLTQQIAAASKSS